MDYPTQKEYIECDGCGRDIPKDKSVKIGDETLCENCIPDEEDDE